MTGLKVLRRLRKNRMNFPVDKTELEKVTQLLVHKKETVSVAESVTAGLLQASFAGAENAIQFFQGGITAYNLGQKCRHLNIDPIHAEGCNCVSDPIAENMAARSCELFCSEWGLGITGYASPVPESGNKLFAYAAIAYKGKILSSKKLRLSKGNMQEVQAYYVNHVLQELAKLLRKR